MADTLRTGMLFVAFLAMCVSAFAEPVDGVSVAMEKFESLPKEDQIAVLRAALEARLKSLGNLHYEALTTITVSQYHNGMVGDPVKKLNGKKIARWIDCDSYRVKVSRGRVDVSTPELVFESAWDSGKKVATSLTHRVETDQWHGRISAEQDLSAQDDRYAFWLDGVHNNHGDFITRYLLQRFGEATFTFDRVQGLIGVTLPWYTPYAEKPAGEKLVWLDPGKGFMPIAGVSQWDLTEGTGVEFWRHEKFFVRESKCVEDVWMPTHVYEVIGSSSFDDAGLVNTHDTRVLSVSRGTVAPEDLEVRFPEGTKVVDELRMETYLVGSKGDKRDVGPVYAVAPEFSETTSGFSRRSIFRSDTKFLLVVINSGLLLTIMSVLVFWTIAVRRRLKP